MKKTIISRILLFLFALTLCGCNLQRNMLYYPGTYLPSQEALAAHHLQFWPSGPDEYRGFVSTAPAGNSKGTIVVFHGNAGTAADRVFYVDALAPLGYRVILAEYPGYGGRKGKPKEAVLWAMCKRLCGLLPGNTTGRFLCWENRWAAVLRLLLRRDHWSGSTA